MKKKERSVLTKTTEKIIRNVDKEVMRRYGSIIAAMKANYSQEVRPEGSQKNESKLNH